MSRVPRCAIAATRMGRIFFSRLTPHWTYVFCPFKPPSEMLPLQHAALRRAPNQSGAPSSSTEASKSPWTEYSSSLKSASSNDHPFSPGLACLFANPGDALATPSCSSGVLPPVSGGPADLGRTSNMTDALLAEPAPRTHAISSCRFDGSAKTSS